MIIWHLILMVHLVCGGLSEPSADVVEIPRKTGFELLPKDRQHLTTEVGLLYRASIPTIPGVKYTIRNAGVVLFYVIEPLDVDLSAMVGCPISLSGYKLGIAADGILVVKMRNASTFG